MGSLVAQEVALSRPDRLKAVVLTGSATTFQSELVAELALVVAAFEDAVPREFATEFQRSTVHRPMPAGFMDRIVDESMKVPARVWRDALVGTLHYSAGERLREIDVPALIACGERDAIAPLDEQRKLNALIPRSRVSIYEEIGHCPHWEATQRFVDELAAFVRASSAP